MKGPMQSPTHTINLNDQIFCFELSPYEWSQHLCCIAVQNKLILALIKFPVTTISQL